MIEIGEGDEPRCNWESLFRRMVQLPSADTLMTICSNLYIYRYQSQRETIWAKAVVRNPSSDRQEEGFEIAESPFAMCDGYFDGRFRELLRLFIHQNYLKLELSKHRW